MAQVQPDVLKRSVTRDETDAVSYSGNGYVGGTVRFWQMGGGVSVRMPYEPPGYWSEERDTALFNAYRRGGQWASAVNIAVTRVMVAGYELDGDVALRVRHARELLGAGWIDLMMSAGRAYSCRDKGAFWEIVRATKAYGSKVLGFVPLSSARCILTGDADIPVVYVDRLGHYHELRDHQVVHFSDMPDEDYYGVGLCATSRAWDSIYEEAAVRAYFKEKATGRRPLELNFMTGMGDNLIKGAIQAAREDSTQQGHTSFMGVAVTGNPNNVPLNHVKIPIASLPDHFNQTEHEELSQIRYANALGIDAVDLNPRLIGNRALGAGSQALTLDDKAKSKGLVGLRQKVAAFFNDVDRWHPLPGGVTFSFSERDLKDQQAEAGIGQTRATTRKTQIESGEITPAQALQLAVDAGDVPESFIAHDVTQEETLTDEDKAVEGIDRPNPDAAEPAPVAPAAQPKGSGIALAEFKQGQHTGAMVALYPRPAAAESLARDMQAIEWPKGATVTEWPEYHVTLAYLGEASDIPDERQTEMIASTERLAKTETPHAKFNGVARFNGSDEDGDAIVILLSDAAVNEMAAFARSEIGNASDHTFNAHITLAYIPKNAPTPTVPPPFESIALPRLGIVFASDESSFDLWDSDDSGIEKKAQASTATLKAVSLKASSYATTLARVIPSAADEPEGRKAATTYWREVTKALDELGSIWATAAHQEVPQVEGVLNNSITYKLTGRNGPAVTLHLMAGNKERPEVAIRSVLYGRKGFGPKRAKALRFSIDGRTVFARKVRGAAANDWHGRAMEKIGPQMKAIENRIASLNVNEIDVSDIPGAKVYRTALPAPKDTKRRRKKK